MVIKLIFSRELLLAQLAAVGGFARLLSPLVLVIVISVQVAVRLRAVQIHFVATLVRYRIETLIDTRR